jgi:dTDP-4-amino-4,6-dideoxygalactose transaminase
MEFWRSALFNKIIQISEPDIGRKEKKAVLKVLKSGNLIQGKEVSAFEEEFSEYVEGRKCVAVNSGTSGLHLALLSLGIGVGDEVIVPSFTFAASANVIVLVGAKPIFVDIDPISYCLNPEKIEKLITKKTRAIMVVHMFGMPANMQEMQRLSQKYRLKIVEDAAQAHYSFYKNKPVGTFGDASVFSFYATKNITSGEGGMITYQDESLVRTAKLLRNQGMEIKYQNELVGFNLRMTEIQATIGREQLKKLKYYTQKRQSNAKILSTGIQFLQIPTPGPDVSHAFHQYTIRVNNRNRLIETLSENGINTGVYYPVPVHKLPSFNSVEVLPETEKACSEVLSLPVHPKLSS